MMPLKTRVKLLLLAALISFSSIFQMGYGNAYVNTAISNFKAFLNDSLTSRGQPMSESLYTWLWSVILNVWFPGFAIGTWIACPISDIYGRKKSLLTGNFLTLFAVILMTIGMAFEVVEFFVLGRFLSALSSGISMSALILFLQEISPSEFRGVLSFFAEMSFVALNTIGAIFGLSFLLGRELTFLVGLAIVPAVISMVVLFPLPDTPKFLLLNRKNKEEAQMAVRFYLDFDDVQAMEFLERLDELPTDEPGVSVFALFRIPHVRFGLLLGVLALQITTSIWPVIYFSTEFLRRANISFTLAEYVTSGMLVLSTLATIFGCILIEGFSRKRMFLVTSALNVLSLAMFVLFSQLQKVYDPMKYGCALAICLHGITYSFSVGPIAWFITAELVPTEFRSTCQAFALSLNHTMAFIFTLLILPFYNLIDSYAILILFVLPSLFCLAFLQKYLPETRGRDIQEVVAELQGDKKRDIYEMRTQIFKEGL